MARDGLGSGFLTDLRYDPYRNYLICSFVLYCHKPIFVCREKPGEVCNIIPTHHISHGPYGFTPDTGK